MVQGRAAIQIALLVIVLLVLWLSRALAVPGIAPRPAHAQSKLLPVDEAARQGDFFAFRARLQAAIAARDSAAVLAAVHPGIKSSFGGDEGVEDFRRMWKLEDSASGLWQELGAALALGGRFYAEDQFVAPYVFSNWPERFDAFEHVAIVGSQVRVRAEPRLDASSLAVLSFDIVALARDGASSAHDAATAPGWTAIRLDDGRLGFVASTYVRSPVTFRAIFNREGARWRLTAFVAGD